MSGLHSLRTKRWRRQDLNRSEGCGGAETGGGSLSAAGGTKEDDLCEVIIHGAELLVIVLFISKEVLTGAGRRAGDGYLFIFGDGMGRAGGGARRRSLTDHSCRKSRRRRKTIWRCSWALSRLSIRLADTKLRKSSGGGG